MKNKKWYFSIQFKIFCVFTIFLSLTCISLFVLFAGHFGKVYRRQAFSHMADMGSLATENVSQLLKQIDQLSVSVLVNKAVQDDLGYINKETVGKSISGDSNQFYKQRDHISDQLRGSVFNVDGVISLRIYSLSGVEIVIGTTNREYMECSLTPEELYRANGAALWEMAGERHYICMGRAILNTTTMMPLGYMMIVCKNDYFSNRMATFPTAYSGNVYLLDEEHTIVAASNADTVGMALQLPEASQEFLKDPSSGDISYYNVGNELDNGWRLATTVSVENLWQAMQKCILQMGMILFVLFVIALILTRMAIRRLVAPTQELLQSMYAFGKGDLSVRVNYESQDEIGQIGKEYNQMAENIQNLLEQVYTLELANKEAEIEFLKMQINPHFLYNTLDTISWLGFTNGSEEISDLAVSLAKLLRSSIKNDDIITVRDELSSVREYLQIQRCRFGDRFSVEYKIEEEACVCYMPNFLLQPLIENSIMHGLEDQLKKGILSIQICRKDWLYFTISDNGKGMDEAQIEKLMEQCRDMKSRTAIGLKNVYRRLQLLYGKECNFRIESALAQGTSISFRIPVITEKRSDL